MIEHWAHCFHYSDGFERCCLCRHVEPGEEIESYVLMSIKELEREIDGRKETDT